MVGHVASIGEMKTAYKIFVRKLKDTNHVRPTCNG
jgi:hypothetical protein